MENKKLEEQIKKIVTESIRSYLLDGKKIETPKSLDKELETPKGVFVTLKTKHDNRLRGCIGIPSPNIPLVEALIESSISSATKDPRFMPVELNEIDNLSFEISIMSEPEIIEVNNYKDYMTKIEIGKHGLIMERGLHRGLLLPQVATEYSWDAETFLTQTCRKAGLNEDAWKDSKTKVYSFYLYEKIEGDFTN